MDRFNCNYGLQRTLTAWHPKGSTGALAKGPEDFSSFRIAGRQSAETQQGLPGEYIPLIAERNGGSVHSGLARFRKFFTVFGVARQVELPLLCLVPDAATIFVNTEASGFQCHRHFSSLSGLAGNRKGF